jgi:hypothetical protein
MGSATVEPTLLEILPDGHLNFSIEQLQQAGLAPGDHLLISAPAPGHLYLHKVDLSAEPLSREALSRLVRDAFEQSGYGTREEVISLVREVRQEMADER